MTSCEEATPVAAAAAEAEADAALMRCKSSSLAVELMLCVRLRPSAPPRCLASAVATATLVGLPRLVFGFVLALDWLTAGTEMECGVGVVNIGAVMGETAESPVGTEASASGSGSGSGSVRLKDEAPTDSDDELAGSACAEAACGDSSRPEPRRLLLRLPPPPPPPVMLAKYCDILESLPAVEALEPLRGVDVAPSSSKHKSHSWEKASHRIYCQQLVMVCEVCVLTWRRCLRAGEEREQAAVAPTAPTRPIASTSASASRGGCRGG